MFSITTMASSSSIPTARMTPVKVTMWNSKPNSHMKAKVMR